jgi:hypothetical protein
MNPMRKRIASQIVPLAMVRKKARRIPGVVSSTAPI